MTTSQIIACAISWTAALVACIPLIQIRRARRRSAPQYHLRWSHGGGTFSAGPLSEAEFDALTERLRRQYTPRKDEEEPDV